MLTRQLATLLGSGIPMIGAITALIDQVEYRDLKAAMMDVREKVSQGGSLSDAMGGHPVYFSELFVNMVRAGEAGGNLDKVLFRVADYMHAQNRTRAKVMAALTYPIIMLLIGTGRRRDPADLRASRRSWRSSRSRGRRRCRCRRRSSLAVLGLHGEVLVAAAGDRRRRRSSRTSTRGRRRRAGSGSTR